MSLRRPLALLLLLLAVAASVPAAAQQLHRIGVLAFRGKAATSAAFGPTADYLSSALPGHRFEIVPLDIDELIEAAAAHRVDFVLTNPEHYIVLEARHGVTRIATIVQDSNGTPLREFGGVVFVRAGRGDLQALADLRGKTLAGVAPSAFGGFLMQAGELQAAGIDVRHDAKVLFLGLPQDGIVQAVAEGRADAGFIRTGVLEDLARKGRIRLADFRVLGSRQEQGFPYLLSTPLYPEWPFAAVPGTPDALAKEVLTALLDMPAGSEPARRGGYHSWAIPLSYDRVHMLMRSLRVAPYDAPEHFDLRDVLRKYEIETFALLALALLATLVAAIRFQRLSGRLAQQNVLVAERSTALETEVATRQVAEARLAAENELLEMLAVASPLPAVLQHLVTMFVAEHPGQPVAILLYDGASQRFHLGAQANLDETLAHAIDEVAAPLPAGAGAQEQTIAAFLDGRTARNLRVEPIRAPAGRLLGCLVSRPPAAPEPGEREFVRNLASLAAVAVEQAETGHRLRLNASVFANALEGILVTDPAGTILDVNEAFTTLTGYSRDEAVGQTPRLLKSGQHDLAFYRELWRSLIEDGRWRGEVWNRRKDGRIIAEILQIAGVRDTSGRTTHYVGIFSDITDLKETQARLEQAATHDALTGLPNRTLLTDRLRQAQSHTQRRGTVLAVCFLDLDEFKPVNDSLGHAVGDRLLKEVAHRLESAVRAGDTVARLGGDEFVLLLLDLKGRDEVAQTLGRLLADLASLYVVDGHPIRISASIGVTLYPDDDGEPDALLRHADQAMYRAKQEGRNRFSLFDAAQNEQLQLAAQQQQRLRQALENGELVIHYQPRVDMRHGRVVGVEALLRWNHPERGLLLPAAFLPAIEHHDLICAIGDWVMAEALRQRQAWLDGGLELTMAVNIAGHHLLKPDFVAWLGRLLSEQPVPPGALELEIVESAAFADLDAMVVAVHDCQALGVRIALDDFGTGHSSLSYLKRLPADILKIDRSFVFDMLLDQESLAIVEGIVSLASAFEREIVAEGVETTEHGTVLLRLGCELAQGYGIARPMPADAVAAWTAGFALPPEWVRWSDAPWDLRDFPLLAAEVAHRHWVEAIIAAGTGDGVEAAQWEGGFDRCGFGDWLERHGRLRYGRQPEFPNVVDRHRDVHRIAHHIVDLMEAGDAGEAHKLLRPLRDASDRLLASLAALQRGIARP